MAQNQWDAKFYDSKHNFVTNYGNSVLELLAPQPNEIILDLGCGSGELTAKIATRAQAIGIDASENMIKEARLRFPAVEFREHNAEKPFPFQHKFDAIFSNAALHWMLNADAVAKNVAEALKPNGRFVFEMGGNGNINTIIKAIEHASSKFGIDNLPIYNFFPSVSEYSSILERNGLQVTFALLFERPTPLDGNDGLQNWIKMFRNSVIEKLPEQSLADFFTSAEEHAKERLFKDGKWYADYVRLRMIAIKK